MLLIPLDGIKYNSLKQTGQIIADEDLIKSIQHIEQRTNMHIYNRKGN